MGLLSHRRSESASLTSQYDAQGLPLPQCQTPIITYRNCYQKWCNHKSMAIKGLQNFRRTYGRSLGSGTTVCRECRRPDPPMPCASDLPVGAVPWAFTGRWFRGKQCFGRFSSSLKPFEICEAEFFRNFLCDLTVSEFPESRRCGTCWLSRRDSSMRSRSVTETWHSVLKGVRRTCCVIKNTRSNSRPASWLVSRATSNISSVMTQD